MAPFEPPQNPSPHEPLAICNSPWYVLTMSIESLKKRRQEAGLEHWEVAKFLGVHAVTIWRWEQGKTRISRHILKAWEAYLAEQEAK